MSRLITERASLVRLFKSAIENKTFSSAEEMLSYVRSKNYVRELGRGDYSVALTGNDPDTVLRITHAQGPLDSSVSYLRACRDAGGSSYNVMLPDVHAIQIFRDGKAAVLMERLDTGLHVEEHLEKIASRVWGRDESWTWSFWMKACRAEVAGDCSRYWDEEEGYDEPIAQFQKAFPILESAVVPFFEFLETELESISVLDMHPRNMGFRGDTLVAFDPVV